MINNTAQDGTPYVLTANHCVSGEPNIEHDISFVFFYRSKYCDSSMPVKNYVSYNEGYVRAKYYKSDFALLEMKQKTSGDKYFYSGWSRDTLQGSFAACLHFPEGDLMKYSESTLPIIDTAYGTTAAKKTMYWIRWTGKGVTENGSSGGVIYNSKKQIIGELYDGPSYCGAKGNDKSDYFGGIYASWKGGRETTNSLKDWLDPLHTNAHAMNGAYITTHTQLQNFSATNSIIKNTWQNISISPVPASDFVKINLPADDVSAPNITASIFSVNGNILISKKISPASTVLDIKSIPAGIYFMHVASPENVVVKKLVVEK